MADDWYRSWRHEELARYREPAFSRRARAGALVFLAVLLFALLVAQPFL